MKPEITEGGDRIVIKLAAERCVGARTLRLDHDPRESGPILWFDVSLWSEPVGTPMTDVERAVVLDALSTEHPTIAQHEDGFDRLHRAPSGERLVGTYQTGHDEGYVTLMFVGKTARVDVTQRFPRRGTTATLIRETARWVYPVQGPINDADWATVQASLFQAERAAFYRGPAWSFEPEEPEETYAPAG